MHAGIYHSKDNLVYTVILINTYGHCVYLHHCTKDQWFARIKHMHAYKHVWTLCLLTPLHKRSVIRTHKAHACMHRHTQMHTQLCTCMHSRAQLSPHRNVCAKMLASMCIITHSRQRSDVHMLGACTVMHLTAQAHPCTQQGSSRTFLSKYILVTHVMGQGMHSLPWDEAHG